MFTLLSHQQTGEPTKKKRRTVVIVSAAVVAILIVIGISKSRHGSTISGENPTKLYDDLGKCLHQISAQSRIFTLANKTKQNKTSIRSLCNGGL